MSQRRASGKALGAHLDFHDLFGLIITYCTLQVFLFFVIALACLLGVHKTFSTLCFYFSGILFFFASFLDVWPKKEGRN